MPRNAEGNVFESRGKLYARTPLGAGKRHCVHLDMPRKGAEARSKVLASIARDVRATKDATTIATLPKLLDAAATADETKLAAVLELVARLVAGRMVPARAVPVASATFKSLGDRWVNSELAAEHPRYIKKKRSAGDDKNLLTKWIYPLVQDVPLRSFTLDHAEQVIRALPDDLSSSTARHVAQTINRVIKMAVYPLRILAANPLPEGWMPKTGDHKKQEAIYTDEHNEHLAHAELPLLPRLFVGFVAREGMRHDEAETLTWADLDLERGMVKLDENKTDDPRGWPLRPGTARALRAFYKQQGEPSGSKLVFSRDGRTKLRLRPEDYRADLIACGINRERLHKGSTVTKPTALHALRALFVTEALREGKTEAWVVERTGHKSSTMVAEYRRAARQFDEINQPPLADLDVALGLDASPPDRDPVRDPRAKVKRRKSLRRERDSNSWYVSVRRFSKPLP